MDARKLTGVTTIATLTRNPLLLTVGFDATCCVRIGQAKVAISLIVAPIVDDRICDKAIN